MVLPLYLAMTAEELAGAASLPRQLGVYAPPVQDLSPGAMLILDDRDPGCLDPGQAAALARRLECESVLLDFERKPDADSITVANALFQALSCPVAAPPGFIENSDSPLFLPPRPLHVPLAEYLHPWQGREIWLDMTMQQQTVTVTPDGTHYGSPAPTDRPDGGWFDEILCCRCLTDITEDEVRFTLFDTPETLPQKMAQAAKLGVSRAVGLYQELNEKL